MPFANDVCSKNEMLSVFSLQDHDIIQFNETDKKNLLKNLAELKTEMSIDTKQLSEQNTIKSLLATKAILEKKLQQIQEENRHLETNVKDEKQNLNKIRNEVDTIKDEIRQLDAIEIKATDKMYDPTKIDFFKNANLQWFIK